jgi:hypothetical protein
MIAVGAPGDARPYRDQLLPEQLSGVT